MGISAQQPLSKAWLFGLPGLAMAFKVGLLMLDAFPFHADEAVVGLMARHILNGDWPAFFYGQAYMGSLDASLVALVYLLTGGASVLGIRVVQIALYAATVGTGMRLAQSIAGDRRTSIFAGALLTLPVVNVTLYTTVSLGGYGEALLIGNVLMLAALAYHRDPGRRWLLLIWGALAGLGFWAFGITLVFILPTAVLVGLALLHSPNGARRLTLAGLALAAAALGAAAWVWSAIEQGPQAFISELLGSAIAGASPSGVLAAAGSHLLGLALFGPTVVAGLRPPWGTELLALPLAPVAVAFWLLVVYRGLRDLLSNARRRPGCWMLAGVGLVTLLGLVVTPFGGDPSGRYFLPLLVPLAIAGGSFLARLPSRRLASVVLVAVLGFNLWGTLQSVLSNSTGITTQFGPDTRVEAAAIPKLAERLLALGELRGYTTYWVAYPLAFHSDERLIFVPRLPYHFDFRHTERDNRYAPYNGMVESSTRVAYITFRHAELDQRLRSGLERAGVGYQESELDGYRIFYGLSARIGPELLDLGIPNGASSTE